MDVEWQVDDCADEIDEEKERERVADVHDVGVVEEPIAGGLQIGGKIVKQRVATEREHGESEDEIEPRRDCTDLGVCFFVGEMFRIRICIVHIRYLFWKLLWRVFEVDRREPTIEDKFSNDKGDDDA